MAAVLLGALIASFIGASRARAQQEGAAQVRAEGYVGSVLFDALTPRMVSGRIGSADARSLSKSISSGILSDPRVVRVRIWASDGTLVFSSDDADRVDEAIARSSSPVTSAAQGRTTSIVVDPTGASGGLAGSDETLYQTFVPLRLFDQSAVSGVAEIDQRYAPIADAASRVWRPIQIVLALGLLGALGLLVLSFRAAPHVPRPADAGFGAGTEPVSAPGEPAAGGEAAAPVSLREAEDRVRAAEARATAAERAAREVEDRARSADQRAVELQAQLSAAEGDRERLQAEVAAAEAAGSALPAELEQRAVAAETGSVGAWESEARTTEDLRTAMTEMEGLRRKLQEAETTVSSATATAAEKETALQELRDQHDRAVEELEQVRSALATAEEEMASLRRAEVAAAAATAAAEAGAQEARQAADQAAELARRIEELEQRHTEDAAALAGAQQAIATGERDRAELERRSEETAERLAQAEARASELEARATEAEERANAAVAQAEQRSREAIERAEHRSREAIDLAERQARGSVERAEERAKESIAQAQARLNDALARSEAAEARADDAESRLRQLEEEAAAPEPVAQLASILTGSGGDEEVSSITARLARVRRDLEERRTEAAQASDASEAEEPEGALSLRERLARSAAARHRVSGN